MYRSVVYNAHFCIIKATLALNVLILAKSHDHLLANFRFHLC